MKRATDRPMHHVRFAQSSSPASHCLIFALALLTSSTPCEKPLRSCTLDTQIMHSGDMRCLLSALCYSFAHVVFVFAFTFATSAAQIEHKLKDKEEFEQWLTAFGRHRVIGICDCALWRHRLCTLDTRAVSCLPFFTLSRALFLSLPFPASTFATSSSQIENKFKDKEKFEQWLTAFGRHQVKKLCDRAVWRHRLCTLDTRAVSCLPFVTLSRAWFLSSPLPASTFATSSSQIEINFNEKEECEQWLTAFGCRDQEKEVDQSASGCHRYTVLNLVN